MMHEIPQNKERRMDADIPKENIHGSGDFFNEKY